MNETITESKALADLAAEYVALRNRIDEVAAQKSKMEGLVELLTDQIITLMVDQRMSSCSVDGNRITVSKPQSYGRVPAENMDEFRTWAMSEALSKKLLMVHAGALAKEVNTRTEEGLPIPSYISVFQKRHLSLYGRKENQNGTE